MYHIRVHPSENNWTREPIAMTIPTLRTWLAKTFESGTVIRVYNRSGVYLTMFKVNSPKTCAELERN